MAKKKISGKKIGILFFILLVFGVIIVIGINQSPLNQPNPYQQKKSAAEYFEISNVVPRDFEYKDPDFAHGGSYENSSALVVYSMSFRLKAKGGTANNVYIPVFGQGEDFSVDVIEKDQSEVVDLDSPRPWGKLIRKVDGEFSFEVTITSDEAEGTITIYLHPPY